MPLLYDKSNNGPDGRVQISYSVQCPNRISSTQLRDSNCSITFV